MRDDTHFVILGETMQRQERRLAHVILDQAGVVQSWQAPMADLFGWKETEAVGVALADLIVPEPAREAHTEGLKRWESTVATVVACKHFRTEGVCKDGTRVDVYVDVQIVREDVGITFLGWVAPVE
jgi:PAS domain S-box-containing protein